MVGVVGFEPTTLCSQSRCATRLRYTPNNDLLSIGASGRTRTGMPSLAGDFESPASTYFATEAIFGLRDRI